MKKNIRNRLKKLQQLKTNQDHESKLFLISNSLSLAYLTGVTSISAHEREAFVIITPQKPVLIVSPLSLEHFNQLQDIYELIAMSPDKRVSTILKEKSLTYQSTSVLFEASDIRVAELDQLKEKTQLEFVPAANYLDRLRLVKDSFEIEAINTACQITATVWEEFPTQLVPGTSEIQLARWISRRQEELGAQGVPLGFAPIVAFGENSAVPHHVSGPTTLSKDMVVLCDFGCSYQGYASDFTRTFYYGKPTQDFVTTQSQVLAAYKVATNLVQADQPVALIDAQVNQLIQKATGQDMIHTTGHGLGLGIHEAPSISRLDNKTKLKENMIITIEPGIYHQGKFGYRHEDTILVTKSGYKNLTNPKA